MYWHEYIDRNLGLKDVNGSVGDQLLGQGPIKPCSRRGAR